MHIINKHNVYMTLTISVIKQLDCNELKDCKVFIGTQAYMEEVQKIYPGITEEEISGTELTVWDDGLVENYHIEHYIDMTKLAEELSNLSLR